MNDKKEIELTDSGLRYMRANESDPKMPLKKKLMSLKNAGGWPHWEIKKALCNSRGNGKKAELALRQIDEANK